MKPVLMFGAQVMVQWKHRPGGLILANTFAPANQVFSFTSEDGVKEHFSIGELLRMIERGSYEQVVKHVTRDVVSFIRSNHGVEGQGIARARSTMHVPGILCLCDDGTELLLDGNHRYIARYMAGLTEMTFWQLTFEQCKPALLDLPEGVI